MKDAPSDQFLAAIVRGYNLERHAGPVTCSAIWDQVVRQCLNTSGGFTEMFAWDTSKATRNRIKTIADCIQEGYVPGLKLSRNDRGREIVVEAWV